MSRRRYNPVAPVKEPITRPAPSPTRPGPAPSPKRDPFNVPKPHILPKPKAILYRRNQLTFENYANRQIIAFWRGLRDSGHLFGQNALLVSNGLRLSRESFGYVANKVHAKNLNIDMAHVYNCYREIQGIERENKGQLEALAKDITIKLWGILPDRLNGEIGPVSKELFDEDTNADFDPSELSESDRAEINKRIICNILTQGGAVHIMLSAHHMVKEDLDNIDDRLVTLYDNLILGVMLIYWSMDLPTEPSDGMQLVENATGLEQIEYDNQEQATVTAQGVCFPILM